MCGSARRNKLRLSIPRTQLKQLVDQLSTGRLIVADNAYEPTEHLLSPFSGSQKAITANNAFNFHLRQLHIKIEQLFGLMTTKWRILRQPLQVGRRNVATVIVMTARLHNFVTLERPGLEGRESAEPLDNNMVDTLCYLPSDNTTVTMQGFLSFKTVF